MDLKRASLYQTKGLLEAKEAVDIKSDRLTAHGTGLVYSFEKGEGFLLGPVTTIMQALNETTMNTPRTPLRATALLGMSLITQSLAAGPPPAMTAEERGALQSDAAPKASKAAEANAVTRQALQTDLADSETASKAAKTFLVQANIPVPAAADPAADAKPLEVKPGPDDTVIDCEGGMYFDADEGCLVFLKNVTVNDPQLDLSAKNELKVFFAKKPAKEKNPDKTEDPKEAGKKSKGAFGNVGANFGEVERIVATGAVRALQKKPDPGQPPVEASGAVFSYNVKSEQIIIHGGAPWVKRGGLITRAKTAEQTLRIDKDGVFDFDGPTQIILPVEELKKR